jgi:hypothetical protein
MTPEPALKRALTKWAGILEVMPVARTPSSALTRL